MKEPLKSKTNTAETKNAKSVGKNEKNVSIEA